MSECKTVTLRTRPLKKGMLSFYLDYYPGYRDQETMKTIRHEGLNIYIYANPKNQRERDFNAAMSEKAEAIRCRRFEAIVNERYDFFDKRKFKADFLEYYRKQLRKHDQKWGFVYQHFYNFVHGKCTFEEIDVDLCNKFREYLLNAKQLRRDGQISKNSASGYWSTFRGFLKILYRNRMIKTNVNDFLEKIEPTYRPFVKTNMYFDRSFNETIGLSPSIFPLKELDNIVICVSGIGSSKGFSVLMVNNLSEYQMISNGQCLPMYWYEENKNPQASLFDDAETNRYIRRDGITDWILKEVRNRFGGTRAITKEHIFYYVYGLLHSKQYRERFADDLKKSLPRIPIVDNVQDFMAFYKAGKELADLHLNYEQSINEQITGHDGDYPFYASMPILAHRSLGVTVNGDIDIWQNEWTVETYQYFTVDKMKFAKVRDENGKLVADKTRIIYNGHITIENIPLKAYEYIVNGKSAIEWIMERYAVTIDKASRIKNDPNDWSREHEQPRYILDLLLSVIILSCQTVDTINSLPKLNI